jgi:hypothetical protein
MGFAQRYDFSVPGEASLNWQRSNSPSGSYAKLFAIIQSHSQLGIFDNSQNCRCIPPTMYRALGCPRTVAGSRERAPFAV